MSRFLSLSNVRTLYEAFKTATSGLRFFVLAYALCLLAFFIIGNRLLTGAFVWPVIFLAATVYNPFLIIPLANAIGLISRIRRIFWLLPFNTVLAYACTAICTWQPSGLAASLVPPRLQKSLRPVLGLCLAAAIVFFGSFMIPNLNLATNIYKVNDSLVEIADFLEADSAENNLSKVILYSNTDLLELREYDPSIESALRRSDMLTYSPDTSDTDAIAKIVSSRQYLHILSLVCRFQIEVKVKRFKKAIKKYHVSYIIVETGNVMGSYYEKAGFTLATTIGDFEIYRLT